MLMMMMITRKTATITNFLLQAIQINQQKPQLVRVADIYAAIPDLVCVGEQWQVVLGALFPALLQRPVFYSRVSGGQWLAVTRVMFDCMKESAQVKEIVNQVIVLENLFMGDGNATFYAMPNPFLLNEIYLNQSSISFHYFECSL